jgi:hypothetical protein
MMNDWVEQDDYGKKETYLVNSNKPNLLATLWNKIYNRINLKVFEQRLTV